MQLQLFSNTEAFCKSIASFFAHNFLGQAVLPSDCHNKGVLATLARAGCNLQFLSSTVTRSDSESTTLFEHFVYLQGVESVLS